MISNKKKGFTLVETLVVMVIIVILSLIIIPNYNSIKQKLAFERSAFKLAQDIRMIQEMAMSAQEYPDCVGTDDYKYGYGIFLKEDEPEKYKLFADCNGDENYSFGADEILEEINFETGIEIDSLSSNNLKIIFTPPDPIVAMKPASVSTAVIIIINEKGQTKSISVNKAGLIYVK